MPRLVSLSACTAIAMTVLACHKDAETPGPDAGSVSSNEESPGSAPDGGVPQGDPICAEAMQHSDLAWIQANVFTPSCATSKCHDSSEPEVDLDLSAGASYANLVNKGSSTQSSWVRVVAGSLSESYLVVSLGRATGPKPRDGFMPLEAPALCDEKLDAIERWILDGAPNN